MGNYRRKLDIIADILLVAREKPNKTRIMYQANLSYKLLTKYLLHVKKACLVRFERREGCYVLTEKGSEFLEKYKEYSRRNKRVERKIDEVNGTRKTLEELCS